MFKPFLPLKDFYKDPALLNERMIAGIMITIGFFCLGVFTLMIASKLIPVQRRRMSYLAGGFLVFCALARAIEVVSIWVNYQWLEAHLMLITGIFSMAALIYLPWVARIVINIKNVHDATEKMEENIRKIDEVKELGEKLNISNERNSKPT